MQPCVLLNVSSSGLWSRTWPRSRRRPFPCSGLLVPGCAGGPGDGPGGSRLRSPPSHCLVSVCLLLLMFSFRSGFRPTLQEQPDLARPIAGLFPSRWAFEGLLLLEAGETEIGTAGSDSQPEKPDLAELYFPAASHRMGTRADALALLLMLIGLSAATVFLSASSTTAWPIQRWGLSAASSDR